MEFALETQIKNELNKVIEKFISSAHFELHIESTSNKGDNFMGEILRIHFKKSNNNGDWNQSLILKIAPNNLIRREKTGVRNHFIREITMYDKVLSYFNDFQLSKGVNPAVDGFNEFPKCYSKITVEFLESLFLEDLRLRQFDMINIRHEELTFEHVSLLMKALGKFHALSFALKDQQPNKFNELANQLPEEYWTMIELYFKDGFKTMFEKLKTGLIKENRFDLMEKIERFEGEDIFKTISSLISSKLAEPYAVICHGDVSTMNSMFRKDESGKPIEVQIFDFQISRYASPVTELVLYILCSTTKELRAKYYDQFLKIYHDSLSDLLMRLGSDPNRVFPYVVFLEQFQKFGAYAVIVGTFLVPMLWADLESMPNMNEVVKNENQKELFGENIFTIQSAENQRTFNKRVTDMIDDIARFGYL